VTVQITILHILTGILPFKCPNKGNEIIHRVALCDVKYDVWCTMSAVRIIGPIFLSEALYSYQYATCADIF
jgi:predicted RNA-binding Zn-ribbon protein involved in translation (DUF1610 family)